MKRTSKLLGAARLVACCSALGACTAEFNSPAPPSGVPSGEVTTQGQGMFQNGAVQTGKYAAPVVGGTLVATRDGSTLAAADPDRDTVFLVDASSHAVRPIALQAGDEPGRIIEGPDGTLFVALRRANAVVAIDVASGTITARANVSGAPRGMAYDAKSSSLYVACRSGQLLTLSPVNLSTTRTLQLDPDLRDVIVRKNDLVVTRYLSAEVMVVGMDGTVSQRGTPDPAPGCATATVLTRAFALPSGQIALAHQVSSDDMVNVQTGGYGMSSPSCGSGGLVSRVVSMMDPPAPVDDGAAGAGGSDAGVSVPVGLSFASAFVPSAGPFDVAFDPASGAFAMTALGTADAGGGGLKEGVSGGGVSIAVGSTGPSAAPVSTPAHVFSTTPSANFWLIPSSVPGSGAFTSASQSLKLDGQPVAVTFNQGNYVVQSREPASLVFQDGSSVSLSSESHADTGHLLFHLDTGIGIACASCHPEGGEDGHVWHFPTGLRRTLPLDGGVMERAPFHWDGSLPDMKSLFGEVMVQRMNFTANVSDKQVAALGSFLEQVPEQMPVGGLDPAAVSRGEALFRRTDVGCATCHSGSQYTNNQLEDVGTGGEFVTPTLLGVGLRSPIFHDGCAKTVNERFGACGGTAHGSPQILSDSERADLVTFLRSL